MSRFALVALALAPAAWAQITPGDTVFAGLSARSSQLGYQARGGDMTEITRLLSGANYRSLTHASVLMGGLAWTPDTELTTGLDFAIGAKLIGRAKIWLRALRSCSMPQPPQTALTGCALIS